MHVMNLKIVLVAGLAAAAVTGCGDSDDNASVPASPTAAVPTTQPPVATPTPGSKKKKKKHGKAQKTATPDPLVTPAGTPVQPPPLTHLKPIHLLVTASGGIVLNPDPIPVGRNLAFTVNGPGLGQKAYIQVYDSDGNEVAYARLLKRDVKMQLPAFDAGKIRIDVHGTKKALKEKTRTVSVR
jgi:hypothetical protein